ncbi:MAG: response regulator transcription factor [Clostridia bacterium]|nr:response regulator transcription factor [Clostridia bacterium]
MNRRIYMVEDEKSLNILLGKYLEKEGYEVIPFSDGTEAIKHIPDKPDLWLLDIMLPDIDGYEIIKRIKLFDKNTPVIFMSARNEELDRVVGLELGSDDYLSKPFLPRELVIRVNKLMERIYADDTNKSRMPVDVDGYKVMKSERTVYDGEEKIFLTNNEFELLSYFADNINIVLTREQILNKVWGFDYFGSDRVVDDTIRRLRKKLPKLTLDTIYGYGYRLH